MRRCVTLIWADIDSLPRYQQPRRAIAGAFLRLNSGFFEIVENNIHQL